MIKRVGKQFRRPKKVAELVPGAIVDRASNIKALARKDEPTIIEEEVPRITNETIAVHREEVLKGARKYIYPLQHSKHRIVMVTTTIVVAAFLALMVYCFAGLYKWHQHNTFLYRATQVLPFPVAKAGSNYVDYENYLFELRHYIHYYQHQLQYDFSGDNKPQLTQYQKQALQEVVDAAYVKMLAKQNHVTVSDKEIKERINEVRNQNRLGNNNKVFADVLRDYWGWSVTDFERSLKQQVLAEKVVAKLDQAGSKKASDILTQLKAGADFTALAKQASDDPAAKISGGDYGFVINRSNPNVPPQVVSELFKLKQGQISEVINAGHSLEIVKVNQTDGTSVAAQHISIKLKDINDYLDPLKKQKPPHYYISI